MNSVELDTIYEEEEKREKDIMFLKWLETQTNKSVVKNFIEYVKYSGIEEMDAYNYTDAFYWASTKEGHLFWYKIDEQWKEIACKSNTTYSSISLCVEISL